MDGTNSLGLEPAASVASMQGLPPELLQLVLGALPTKDRLCTAPLVCKEWRQALFGNGGRNPAAWQSLDLDFNVNQAPLNWRHPLGKQAREWATKRILQHVVANDVKDLAIGEEFPLAWPVLREIAASGRFCTHLRRVQALAHVPALGLEDGVLPTLARGLPRLEELALSVSWDSTGFFGLHDTEAQAAEAVLGCERSVLALQHMTALRSLDLRVKDWADEGSSSGGSDGGGVYGFDQLLKVPALPPHLTRLVTGDGWLPTAPALAALAGGLAELEVQDAGAQRAVPDFWPQALAQLSGLQRLAVKPTPAAYARVLKGVPHMGGQQQQQCGGLMWRLVRQHLQCLAQLSSLRELRLDLGIPAAAWARADQAESLQAYCAVMLLPELQGAAAAAAGSGNGMGGSSSSSAGGADVGMDAAALDGLGRLTALTQLHLNHMGLCEVPPFVSRLRHLRALQLDGNRITALPAWLSGLSDLTSIRLFWQGGAWAQPSSAHVLCVPLPVARMPWRYVGVGAALPRSSAPAAGDVEMADASYSSQGSSCSSADDGSSSCSSQGMAEDAGAGRSFHVVVHAVIAPSATTVGGGAIASAMMPAPATVGLDCGGPENAASGRPRARRFRVALHSHGGVSRAVAESPEYAASVHEAMRACSELKYAMDLCDAPPSAAAASAPGFAERGIGWHWLPPLS